MLSNTNYTFRYSKKSDAPAIEKLIRLRFGVRKSAMMDIENRYLLCFDGSNLIAMSGLNRSCAYNGLEVDWTCTHPCYERQGIMSAIFAKMLADVKEDVYCSCWKSCGKTKVNLSSIMHRYNFVPIVEPRVSFDSRYNNCASTCAGYVGTGCKCCEDLYVRRFNQV